MKKSKNICLICGKNLKYSSGFFEIPPKRDVLFIIEELNLDLPRYISHLEETEKIERYRRFLRLTGRDSFPTGKPYEPKTSEMTEEEWNKWHIADVNYRTERWRTKNTILDYNSIPGALNRYFCNINCFKKMYKKAKKHAKQKLYRQKPPQVKDLSTTEMSKPKLKEELMEEVPWCRICKDDRTLELHRIIPGEYGGKYTKGNTVLLCPTCHNLAHGRGVT